jgi:hypothetical protein
LVESKMRGHGYLQCGEPTHQEPTGAALTQPRPQRWPPTARQPQGSQASASEWLHAERTSTPGKRRSTGAAAETYAANLHHKRSWHKPPPLSESCGHGWHIYAFGARH